MKKSSTLTNDEIQAEVDKKVREYFEQYRIDHTPVVSTKYGNTYIKVNKYDYDSCAVMKRIEILLDLMKVKYCSSIIVEDEEFYISIEGEDVERASYIQMFIENGYRLQWSKV